MTTNRMAIVLAVVLALSPTATVTAVTRNWIATDGNWSNNGNWDPFGAPVTGDVANIVFGDGNARTINYDYTGPAVTPDSVILDLSGSLSRETTLSMPANNLRATNEYVGYSGLKANNKWIHACLTSTQSA